MMFRQHVIDGGNLAYDKVSVEKTRNDMRRLCGLILFSVGVGMAVKVLIPTTLALLIFIIGLLVLGYNLFCHC